MPCIDACSVSGDARLCLQRVSGSAPDSIIQGYVIEWSEEDSRWSGWRDRGETQAEFSIGSGRYDVIVSAVVHAGSNVSAHITIPQREDGGGGEPRTPTGAGLWGKLRLVSAQKPPWFGSGFMAPQLLASTCPGTTRKPPLVVIQWSGASQETTILVPCNGWRCQRGATCCLYLLVLLFCFGVFCNDPVAWRFVFVPSTHVRFCFTGNFKAGCRFTFNIYECTENGHKLLEIQTGYAQELREC